MKVEIRKRDSGNNELVQLVDLEKGEREGGFNREEHILETLMSLLRQGHTVIIQEQKTCVTTH